MPVKKPFNESPELLALAPQGVRYGVESPNCVAQVHYEAPGGKLFLGDSITWLRSLEAGSVDMVFADPPYNIKKAEWDDFGSMNAYVAWSREWITEAARVLKPTGAFCLFWSSIRSGKN
jgi:site-specific DNA-methyltransferase (adenine-specific)